jgi:hypothetical protein
MITQATQHPSLLCAATLALSSLLADPGRARAHEMVGSDRPRAEAACQVMKAHVADLLDQHRRSDDLDDAAFGKVLSLFYEAQSACTLGRFSEGVAIYTAIPIGRVSPRLVR